MIINRIMPFLAHILFFRTKKPTKMATLNIMTFEISVYRMTSLPTFNLTDASLAYT
jgi:hypothetical protein